MNDLLDSFVEYYCPICSLNFKIWNSEHYILRPLKKITVERNKTIFPVYRCLHCRLYYELIDQKPKKISFKEFKGVYCEILLS